MHQREIAAKIVMNKFRIGAGEVKGVAVAPLGKAKFVPDALIFTCFPWQAYYLTNAYLWMTGDAPYTSRLQRTLLFVATVLVLQAGRKR